MQNIRVSKGFDITLKGKAKEEIDEIPTRFFAVKPTDFNYVTRPKVLVDEGDSVLAGDPLFYDKKLEGVYFTSPVSGTVSQIKRGNKRALLEVIVEKQGKQKHKDFSEYVGDNPQDLSQEEILKAIQVSGNLASNY